MSLEVDAANVHAVLLADGWHNVVDDSFELGDTGFSFTEHLPASTAQSGRRIVTKGPISSILAVREKARQT